MRKMSNIILETVACFDIAIEKFGELFNSNGFRVRIEMKN